MPVAEVSAVCSESLCLYRALQQPQRKKLVMGVQQEEWYSTKQKLTHRMRCWRGMQWNKESKNPKYGHTVYNTGRTQILPPSHILFELMNQSCTVSVYIINIHKCYYYKLKTVRRLRKQQCTAAEIPSLRELQTISVPAPTPGSEVQVHKRSPRKTDEFWFTVSSRTSGEERSYGQ